MLTAPEKQALIAEYVEQNPHRPGKDEARLKKYGVSVWAIAEKYRVTNGNAAHVAWLYEVPIDAIEAAIAYYEQHKAIIENRIAANYPDDMA